MAQAILEWGLDYVVLTSVNRDELPDQVKLLVAYKFISIQLLHPSFCVHILISIICKRCVNL